MATDFFARDIDVGGDMDDGAYAGALGTEPVLAGQNDNNNTANF